ncbi:MAG TPA: SDR family oxidoreductase [Flavisolibacter sp.]|jgi:hypothetical protein|nr:SDR family oxidoreductase [Flavisolibacter sp.]
MPYALITGASKGIGRSIALELAARKIDLLLVARNGQALKELSEELIQKHFVQVQYLVKDLAVPGSANEVYNWCLQNNYSVQYLINNAGYGLSGRFENYPLADHLNMMEVNMNTLVALCYLFLPQLRQQKQAYIMNIASSAAYQAVPYLAVYAATKAFVLQFSRALNYELKDSPVSVTCISPGATKTGFDARANLGPKALKTAAKLQMQPEAVAKMAVTAMFNRNSEIITGFVNKIGAAFVWLLPKKLVEKMAAGIYE